MAAPYSAEPTIRILDKAVSDWLSTFLVDYKMENENGEVILDRKQHPLLHTVSSPDRAFAQVSDLLVANGMMDASSPLLQRARADYDWAVLPLPIATIDRDEPTPNNDLQMPPTVYRTQFMDNNGNYTPMPVPLHYVTVYRITFWCRNRYTHSHFMEWLLAQQGLGGAGPQEIYIPVDHVAPWGRIMHSLRYTESANLSSLEGDDPRYIRTQVAFVMRSWLFRAFPDESRGVEPVYNVEADVDPSNGGGIGQENAPPFQPNATFNLYTQTYARNEVATAWPRYGAATVALSNDPYISVTLTDDAADRVPLLRKLTTLGVDGRAYLSLGMRLKATAPFYITLRQSALDGTSPALVRRRLINFSPGDDWKRIHMFSAATGAMLEWSIESAGSATTVYTDKIDARQVRNVRTLPPTTYTDANDVISYVWHGLSTAPYIIYAIPYAGAGDIAVFPSNPSAEIGRGASVFGTDDAAVGLLTMPSGSSLTAEVPIALGVSAVFAVPFDGPYLGDHDMVEASTPAPPPPPPSSLVDPLAWYGFYDFVGNSVASRVLGLPDANTSIYDAGVEIPLAPVSNEQTFYTLTYASRGADSASSMPAVVTFGARFYGTTDASGIVRLTTLGASPQHVHIGVNVYTNTSNVLAGGVTGGNAFVYSQASTPICHVVGILDTVARTLDVYVDGVWRAQHAVSVNDIPATFVVATVYDLNSDPLAGVDDMFAISGALSAEAIAKLASGGMPRSDGFLDP